MQGVTQATKLLLILKNPKRGFYIVGAAIYKLT